MPTVFLVDVSLSMARPVYLKDCNENHNYKSLAVLGLSQFLDYLSQNCKLEFVSLMFFSSLWERSVRNFTRDFQSIKNALSSIDNFYDKTNITNALGGVQELVKEEWGNMTECRIVLITDGRPGMNLLPNNVSFNFPCKFHILCLSTHSELCSGNAIDYYKMLIETASKNSPNVDSDNQLWMLENYSLNSVSKMFQKLSDLYSLPKTTLRCGTLSCSVVLFPPLENYVQNCESEEITSKPSGTLEICGFLNINELSSPPVHTRHLVFASLLSEEEINNLPSLLTLKNSTNYEINASTSTDIEEAINGIISEESRQPSFCVLLHGSLKIEGMVAICKIGFPNWYGMLYSWADSKKKSNLMLSTFDCGTEKHWFDVIPILPSLILQEAFPEPDKSDRKKSYSQNCVVWSKQTGLQSDIQKVLRLAKKLPEKTMNFYKELNRFRKAALTLGFHEIIDGLAKILERECTLLPGTAHPEAAMQLTHSANALLSLRDLNSYDTLITPLKTNFTEANLAT